MKRSLCLTLCSYFGFTMLAAASENVPHSPFAEWANLPQLGQLIVGANYQESESYYFWDAHRRYTVEHIRFGERYGIDINQGWISFQYGVTERWAIDLAVGYTTVGWRFFSNFATNGSSRSTSGPMDSAFGVRYQIFKEGEGDCPYTPNLVFRAGAVLPGRFNQSFPFAPGVSSVAIEPGLLLRKHFGWDGFGAYADGLFRWNKTSANDQYIVSVGFFQQIQRWELNAGYRHLGSISGNDIQYNPTTHFIFYPRSVRENNDSIEAGFSYHTLKRQIRYGFYTRSVWDGSNTDRKFWVGAYVEVPFMLLKSK